MEMNYQKALNILGLSDNYSDKELKKAYYNLARKYHPDVNTDKLNAEQIEEKMKEINAAKEFLETYKKGSKQYDGYNEKENEEPIFKNIDIYKDEKARSLFNIIKFYKDYQNLTTNTQIHRILRKFEILIETHIRVILDAKSKEEVDERFNKSKFIIEELFYQIKTEFYKDHNINEQDVTETLNYDCTLKEFVEQLTKIEQKYGINIEKYKENTILKMQQMINFNQTRKLNFYLNDYQTCQKKINRLMSLIMQYSNIFKSISDSNRINSYFNMFKQHVATELYDEIKKQYYQENYILESEVLEQLNYDCEIKDFCDQLIIINMKDKERKENQVISRLENEISKYKYIPLYDEIQILVKMCKSKTLNNIKNNKFQNTTQLIKEMHKDINNMFKRYAVLKKRLIKLEPKIAKKNNELLNKLFNNIKMTCGKIDLDMTEMFLDELESKIKEKNNQVENIEETKLTLKSIKNQIISEFKLNKQENNKTKNKK